MFKTGQNFSPVTNGPPGRTRWLILALQRLSLLLVFIVWLSPAVRCRAEEGFAVVRSYEGNFLVMAPDMTTAAASAKLAEVTRKAVLDLLKHEGEWGRAASIFLRAREHKTAEGELPLWTISIIREKFKVADEDVYPNRKNDVVVLQVVALCLEDIAGGDLSDKSGLPSFPVPFWLSCGVAENLSRENVARLGQSVSDMVRTGEFLPIDQLFLAGVLPSDEAKRGLFFRESASLVDFLLHQPDGRWKLRGAIASFRAEGRDFTSSLLSAFGHDFGSLGELQERWSKFAVERVERTISAPKMLLSETKESLDRVLTVDIPVINRDTLEEEFITTDLRGLFQHRDRRVVRRIASEKASEVFHLSLRARPKYAPILREYLEASSAIKTNDRRAFKKHFALAERLRKELESSPYFEAEETEHGDTANE